MKHWQRFLGTLIALATAAAWVVFYQPEAGDEQKQQVASFSKLIDGVSRHWNLEVLDDLMLSEMQDANRYQPLLIEASPLGRFIGCERLRLGAFAEDSLDQPPLDRLQAVTVYQGNGRCAFEYGEAYVLVGYVREQDQPKLVLLVIEDIHLFDGST
ncbi:hypothetical protein [Marinobacter fonticola]|uniref:hypothetical protein n=1 Tax=Marinobacter fonticola TaxID=2603215 RepID=UPI0011E8799C|nr:hypothetical protein [Marinobacter fonticola]